MSSPLVFCLPSGLFLRFLLQFHLKNFNLLRHFIEQRLLLLLCFFAIDFINLLFDFVKVSLLKSRSSLDLWFYVVSTKLKFLNLLLSLLFLILADSQQVESYLWLSVLLDPCLNLISSFLQPVIGVAFSKRDRTWLKAVKLVKLVFVRNVPNEMENIVVLPLLPWIFFDSEWVLSRKRIVHLSY